MHFHYLPKRFTDDSILKPFHSGCNECLSYRPKLLKTLTNRLKSYASMHTSDDLSIAIDLDQDLQNGQEVVLLMGTAAATIETLELSIHSAKWMALETLTSFACLRRLDLTVLDIKPSESLTDVGCAISSLPVLTSLEVTHVAKTIDLTLLFDVIGRKWLTSLSLVYRPATVEGFWSSLEFADRQKHLESLSLDIKVPSSFKSFNLQRRLSSLYPQWRHLKTVTLSIRQDNTYLIPRFHASPCISELKLIPPKCPNLHSIQNLDDYFSAGLFNRLTAFSLEFKAPTTYLHVQKAFKILATCESLISFKLHCPSYTKSIDPMIVCKHLAPHNPRPLKIIDVFIPLDVDTIKHLHKFTKECTSLRMLQVFPSSPIPNGDRQSYVEALAQLHAGKIVNFDMPK
ncbi:hypothetical protein BC829DRAFT_301298 [Chytridium lagenaria]|nr:hypothetical protein BC829DRAFT_301298 [Chytridium lagenaria]